MAVACATDLATAAINPEVACASECYTSLGNAYTSFVDEVRACVRRGAVRRGAARRGAYSLARSSVYAHAHECRCLHAKLLDLSVFFFVFFFTV